MRAVNFILVSLSFSINFEKGVESFDDKVYGEGDKSWMDVGDCGGGLTCDQKCQLECLKMHNYYRELHDSPPLSCDPELARSAQDWTDQQAADGRMYHSKWTSEFTESISWKGWGWEGMDKMEGAIPGAVRSWYSEIKFDYNYEAGEGNGQAIGHFQAVTWKGEERLGCGLNIKAAGAKAGTFVTAHYAPASHVSMDKKKQAPDNIKPRKQAEKGCDQRSSEREPCSPALKAPFVKPEDCIRKGCCYDDMFMSESNMWYYNPSGRVWCFKKKGGQSPTSSMGSPTSSPSSTGSTMEPSSTGPTELPSMASTEPTSSTEPSSAGSTIPTSPTPTLPVTAGGPLCGEGLTCGPECQLLCLNMHNYYRDLHGSPPMECDPELAKSAQDWTDRQAQAGYMHHSEWTDKFTESISWKGWGWEGMDEMEGAIPGAVRSWYSEIKNGYNYQTGRGAGVIGHFQAVVWKGETRVGCGLNIKPNDGTYVTAHYAPPSHVSMDKDKEAPDNVKPRQPPEPGCDVLSGSRQLCKPDLKAPFVNPGTCLREAGCCYDDMFMSEQQVKHYGREGRIWCFKKQ